MALPRILNDLVSYCFVKGFQKEKVAAFVDLWKKSHNPKSLEAIIIPCPERFELPTQTLTLTL
jgi:hypothetical protein